MKKNMNKEELDEFVTHNYTRLLKYCKDYGYQEDTLNDVYIKVYNRLCMSGLTNSGLYTYFVNSIRNSEINIKKSVKLKKIVNIIDNNYKKNEKNEIKVFELDKLEKNIKNERDEIDNKQYAEYIISNLFRFLEFEVKLKENEIIIFKEYFLNEKKMSFQKVADKLKIEKKEVQRIITKIRRKINRNFKNYLQPKTE